ncbi:helix-turn-helix domain-containing protein [Citrobacter cronae]|uniref:helix-turn-helix domain-containing protein n=1 Tax=Citrobacter cronae TaxID=1748967 RepID=UPI001901CD86|nr:helix-turn-helix domain-containing protein [Citrobacter cronae]MBJ8367705.1 helix-turn-helix domain-containing protein [Citrobacter cronae]MBJ8394163.1 helix-turn-helix domain-containing protein [Citrobacter cronae]MBJ8409470.1 helix-turn-helix domain-containing protein [Citrobacter cronae]
MTSNTEQTGSSEELLATNITKLFNALLPLSEVQSLYRSGSFIMDSQGENGIWLLTEGRIVIRRRTDGLILASQQAPMMLGMAEFFLPTGHNFYDIEAVSPCTTHVVKKTDFMTIVNRDRLWESVAIVEAYIIQVMSQRDRLITSRTATDMVWGHLELLQQEPDDVRKRIPAVQYIRERTGLSRSTIMDTLARLKRQGAIQLHRGHLICISAD